MFGAAGCSLLNQAHSLFNLEGIDPHGNNVSVWTRWDYGSSAASRPVFVADACDGMRFRRAYVDPALPLFNGHFPEHPVLPGVIIMEALAQAASFCVLEARGAEGAIGFLTGVDKAKFRHQVQPGDTLRLEADIVKSSSRMVVAEVVATVDGKVAASATQKYVLA